MGVRSFLNAVAKKSIQMEAWVRTLAVIAFYEPYVMRLSPLASVGRVVGNDLQLHDGMRSQKTNGFFLRSLPGRIVSYNCMLHVCVVFEVVFLRNLYSQFAILFYFLFSNIVFFYFIYS